MGVITVAQSLDQLELSKPIVIRSWEHRTKSNNFLKKHHAAMRRKPFKRECFVVDEMHLLFNKNTPFLTKQYKLDRKKLKTIIVDPIEEYKVLDDNEPVNYDK